MKQNIKSEVTKVEQQIENIIRMVDALIATCETKRKKIRSGIRLSLKLLKYNLENPNQRYWQSIRNTSSFPFIFGGSDKGSAIDTFFEEENFEDMHDKN